MLRYGSKRFRIFLEVADGLVENNVIYATGDLYDERE